MSRGVVDILGFWAVMSTVEIGRGGRGAETDNFRVEV